MKRLLLIVHILSLVFITGGFARASQETLFERSLDTLREGPGWTWLGEYFAIEGEWMVASARSYRTDPSTTGVTGGAVVYRRGADGWLRHSVLTPHDPWPGEQFSRAAVSIQNGQIAVGGPAYRFWSSNGPVLSPGPRGRVVLFELQGDTWVRTQQLVAPDFASIPFPYNGFGASVAFAGEDELLVGAPSDLAWTDPNNYVPGSYYVFRKDLQGHWRFFEKVRAQSPLDQVPFIPVGQPIHLVGDTAMAVNPGLWAPPTAPVAIMTRDASGHWVVDDVFYVPFLNGNSSIASADLSEDFMVFGDDQSRCTPGGARPGRAHVFRRQGATWAFLEYLESRDPYSGATLTGCVSDGFGASVDLQGTRLAVGAVEGAQSRPDRRGSVEIFQFDGTRFVREYLLLPSEDDFFGFAPAVGSGVALTEDSVIVGANAYPTPIGTTGQYTRGAVLFYDLPHGDLVCVGQPNSTGQGATLAMFGSRSAEIGDVYGKAQSLPPGAFCLPLLGSSTAFVPAVGGGMGNLCVGGALGRFETQIGAADAGGEFQFDVDAEWLPLAAGLRPLMSGDRWTFQVWYRDIVGAASTHNLTHAVSVTFGD